MSLGDDALERLREVFLNVCRDHPAMIQAGDQLTAALRQMLRTFGLDADAEDVLATMFVTATFIKFLRTDRRARSLIAITGDPETDPPWV